MKTELKTGMIIVLTRNIGYAIAGTQYVIMAVTKSELYISNSNGMTSIPIKALDNIVKIS